MFNETKYTRWYYNIITNAQARQHEGYGENHHIVPRSLGGDDSPNNLVRLTPREHYLCHALLARMVDSRNHMHKMYAAFNMMHVGTNGMRYTSRLYEYYKVKFYKLHSEQMTGTVRTLESRKKQSRATKGKPWSEAKKASAWVGPTAVSVQAFSNKTKELVGEFESISQAAASLDLKPEHVWKIYSGFRVKGGNKGKTYPIKSAKGYVFRFKSGDDWLDRTYWS